MDFSKKKIVADDAQYMEIKDPVTDEVMEEDGKVARLKVVGSDSKVFKAGFKEWNDKNRLKKNGLSTADTEKHMKKIYCACVVGWENIEWEGKDMKFSKENLMNLIDSCPFIYDQLMEFVGDRSHFLES